MGIEGEGGNGEAGREVIKMGIRGGWKDARVHGKEGIAKGKIEGKDGEPGVVI